MLSRNARRQSEIGSRFCCAYGANPLLEEPQSRSYRDTYAAHAVTARIARYQSGTSRSYSAEPVRPMSRPCLQRGIQAGRMLQGRRYIYGRCYRHPAEIGGPVFVPTLWLRFGWKGAAPSGVSASVVGFAEDDFQPAHKEFERRGGAVCMALSFHLGSPDHAFSVGWCPPPVDRAGDSRPSVWPTGIAHLFEPASSLSFLKSMAIIHRLADLARIQSRIFEQAVVDYAQHLHPSLAALVGRLQRCSEHPCAMSFPGAQLYDPRLDPVVEPEQAFNKPAVVAAVKMPLPRIFLPNPPQSRKVQAVLFASTHIANVNIRVRWPSDSPPATRTLRPARTTEDSPPQAHPDTTRADLAAECPYVRPRHVWVSGPGNGLAGATNVWFGIWYWIRLEMADGRPGGLYSEDRPGHERMLVVWIPVGDMERERTCVVWSSMVHAEGNAEWPARSPASHHNNPHYDDDRNDPRAAMGGADAGGAKRAPTPARVGRPPPPSGHPGGRRRRADARR
eukprot:gene13760-biopygen4440